MLDGRYPEDVLPSGCVEVCNAKCLFLETVQLVAHGKKPINYSHEKHIFFDVHTVKKNASCTNKGCLYLYFSKGTKTLTSNYLGTTGFILRQSMKQDVQKFC